MSCPGTCDEGLVCTSVADGPAAAQRCCQDISGCAPCAASSQAVLDQYGCATCECAPVVLPAGHCGQDESHCSSAHCDAATGRCERCKSGRYLLDGICVEVCPVDLVAWGEGAAGRACVAPFSCRADDGCECPLGGCQECEVGLIGTTCTQCVAERFLVSGKCRKELTCRGKTVSVRLCPHGGANDACLLRWDDCHRNFCDANRAPGHVSRSPAARASAEHAFGSGGAFGSLLTECAASFPCPTQFEETGAKCHCRTATEKDCHVCTFSGGPAAPVRSCKRCRNSRFFLEGSCVEQCPEGLVPAGKEPAFAHLVVMGGAVLPAPRPLTPTAGY